VKLRPFATYALAGCALANVIFLEQWEALLRVRDPAFSYYLTSLSGANYWALMADVVILGLVGASLAVVAERGRRLDTRWAAIIIIAAGFLLALNALRREMLAKLRLTGIESAFAAVGRLNRNAFVLSSLVIVVGAVILVVSSPGRLRRSASFVKGFGLALSPFLLFTFGSAAWILLTTDLKAAFADAPLATHLPRSNAIRERVVILVFDEADYRLMFDARPANLELPEFDRLRRESLFATRALPPATETDLSLPSYIVGRRVTRLLPVSPRDATISLEDHPMVTTRFSREARLFNRARVLGADIALVGWGHPYCRIIRAVFTACHARGLATPPTSLVSAALWYTAEAVTIGPFLDRAYGFGPPYHALDYFDLRDSAKKVIGSAAYDLVFIHLPVPHEPRIYDRRTGRFVGPQRHTREGYLDNLALADITLGELGRTLATSGQADNTALLVTSDHPYRLAAREGLGFDARVPFLARMHGMTESIEYSAPFNTVILGDIALAILEGRFHSGAELTRELDHVSPCRGSPCPDSMSVDRKDPLPRRSTRKREADTRRIGATHE